MSRAAARNRALWLVGTGGLRNQLGVVFTLVTLIPVLACVYLVVRYVMPSADSHGEAVFVLSAAFALCGLGWLVMIGLTREIQRLAARARSLTGGAAGAAVDNVVTQSPAVVSETAPAENPRGSCGDEIGSLDEALAGIDQTIRGQMRLLTDKTNQVRFLMRSVEIANEELAELHRMKSRIIALATHEFRNPLQTVLETASLFEDGVLGDLTDEQVRFVNHIAASGRTLERLIGQMVMLARIGEAPDRAADTTTYPAGEILDEVVDGGLPLAMACGCSIDRVDGPDGASLAGARADLVTAMRGALDSLVRRTCPGGSVRVSVSSDQQFARFTFSAEPLELAEAAATRLLSSITSVDGNVEDWNGLGELELPIAKELLRLQGGSLSAHRSGERFDLSVVLPVAACGKSGPGSGAVDMEKEKLHRG